MDLKNLDAKKVDNIKDKAGDLIDNLANNKEAKAAVNKAIDGVEKKVKVDLPDVDKIKKLLD